MGKGDKKTKRGKIFRGTHGKSRPKPKKKNNAVPEKKETAKKTTKKTAKKK